MIPSVPPGFDPWTFGTQVQSFTGCATADTWIEPPKPKVVSPPFVLSLFSLSIRYYILCPYFSYSDCFHILCACSSYLEKRFGVLGFSIFGSGSLPLPFNLVLDYHLLSLLLNYTWRPFVYLLTIPPRFGYDCSYVLWSCDVPSSPPWSHDLSKMAASMAGSMAGLLTLEANFFYFTCLKLKPMDFCSPVRLLLLNVFM